MAKPLNFPEALNHENKKWAKKLAKQEIKAHKQTYDRAHRIYKAFYKAGIDTWLNPEGNHNPNEAPQYKLGGYESTFVDSVKLKAKVDHRKFRIATLAEVDFIAGTKLEGFEGVSLYQDDEDEPRPALSAESPTFKFIDSVLVGLEQQAVDLGVLKPETTQPTAEVA